MTTAPSSIEMMNAHVFLNLGIFFDDVKLLRGISFATSKIIPDHYWNFAFTEDGTGFDQQALEFVRAGFRSLARKPAIWQTSNASIPSGWATQSEEAWMWMDMTNWRIVPNRSQVPNLRVEQVTTPLPEMVRVFDDAYSSGGDESDIGYFRLPEQYSIAYSRAAARDPCIVRHFGGWVEDRCVAVASAGVWDEIGGLYSVATRHGHRQEGFGTAISSFATEWALANGARGVLLQATAGSEVERMYEQLGYLRTHIGRLLAPVDPSDDL